LQIPGTTFTIQTSDFAKIALVMYMAKILSVNQNNISDFKDVFGKVTFAIVGICGLILPANFSTAVLVFMTAFSLMFVARIPIKYLVLMIFSGLFAFAIFLGGSELLGKEGRTSTWKNRIESFVSGEGDSYQADQAKVAIVQGGLFGKGPGNSTQRNLVPHPYSDFIYAIIIEEYGSVIGGAFVLILYLWLFYRAGLIIRRSRSTYGAFLAFGLSFGLVLQAFVNMAVAVGLVPVTGQTLPLVSMGGSSIIFTSMAVGMILSVSWGCDETRIKSEESQESSPEDDQNSQTSEALREQARKKGTEASGSRNKKQKRTRTEFEINA
jgi:cell division protein FtsW